MVWNLKRDLYEESIWQYVIFSYTHFHASLQFIDAGHLIKRELYISL